MMEGMRAIQWLVTKLSGDATITANATGGIFRGQAPSGTGLPFMIIQQQGSRDVDGAPGFRFFTEQVIVVKAIGRSTQDTTLVTIMDRVDALIQRGSGTASGSTIYQCLREQEIIFDEEAGGVLMTTIGGQYRIWVKE
jgi:hypothetical protein